MQYKRDKGCVFPVDLLYWISQRLETREGVVTTLEQAFDEVYTKFKLHFYQEIFSRFQDREASLTAVETFAMETIKALGSPTVNEFASFMRISPPNAAYKVNSLVKKGYIRKVQSPDDRREYHLVVTQKYRDYYNISYQYLKTVIDRAKERFEPQDLQKLEEMLTVVSKELMPEIQLPDRDPNAPGVLPRFV